MPPETNTSDEHRKWLQNILPLHERLSSAVASLIENMLRKNEVEFLSVTQRSKELEGAMEKIRRKEYTKPREQLTDLSAIRVITYLEDHVKAATNLVRSLFDVDEDNSHDRSVILGDDKIGYRSTHLVCTLGTKRDALPEYEALGKLKFEVQIRTVLQHAWAELAHDRSFKFGIALPTAIQRKLNLYSGMLEIVDGSFNEISKEIDAYKLSVMGKNIHQLSQTEINSISIAKFVESLAKEINVQVVQNTQAKVLKELQDFGVKNIGELERLASPEFKKLYSKHDAGATTVGLLRRLMMFADLEKYFGTGHHFDAVSPGTLEFLAEKYGANRVKRVFKKEKITVPSDARQKTKRPPNPRKRD